MKIVCTIEARMKSSRLPGKVLLPVCGKPLLELMIERLRQVPELDGIVIATTADPSCQPIEDLAKRLRVGCFRGSEDDVIDRYLGAAQTLGAGVIVRVTSDCPLFDGALLDKMLAEFNATNGLDYFSNVQERRFPRGLDAKIFTVAALALAHRKAKEPHEREHVTPYIYQHPEQFRLGSFVSKVDLSDHRWTLDTQEDLQFIEAVYAALGPRCTTADVLNLLKTRPELAKLDAHVEQKKLAP